MRIKVDNMNLSKCCDSHELKLAISYEFHNVLFLRLCLPIKDAIFYLALAIHTNYVLDFVFNYGDLKPK